MALFDNTKTYKVVYSPPPNSNSYGTRVAFVEAPTQQLAMHNFMEEYAGQYFVINSCTELIK